MYVHNCVSYHPSVVLKFLPLFGFEHFAEYIEMPVQTEHFILISFLICPEHVHTYSTSVCLCIT